MKNEPAEREAVTPDVPALKRRLNLPLLTLYGIGTTVGAGIYVLVGKVVGEAGVLAPVSFLMAGIIAALSAGSFAELSSRYPVSGGEAVYVSHGFGSRLLSTAIGLLVILTALVSAATIVDGFVGYLHAVLPWSPRLLVVLVTLALACVAAWGILESVLIAAVITMVEIGGLLLIVWVGRDLAGEALQLPLPPLSATALTGVASGAVLAFFAFVGFQDVVNVAEEVRDVRRTLPRAIVLTLVISTALYVLVSIVGVLGLSADFLRASEAPLADLYQSLSGHDPALMLGIAMVAVLNGALIQIILAARMSYALSRSGQLPALFSRISSLTHTPLVATLTAAPLVAAMALALPIVSLARFTSLIVLLIFAFVNASLVAIKLRGGSPGGVTVPMAVPIAGTLASTGLALFEMLALLQAFVA